MDQAGAVQRGRQAGDGQGAGDQLKPGGLDLPGVEADAEAGCGHAQGEFEKITATQRPPAAWEIHTRPAILPAVGKDPKVIGLGQ